MQLIDYHAILWKVCAMIVNGLCPLMLITWLPFSTMIEPVKANTHIYKMQLVHLQETPTADPTMTELQKEQLTQQINQLKIQNDHSLIAWLWNNAAPIALVLVALFGGLRWFRERSIESKKRTEERFQAVVESIGGERTETKVGAAIMLRTFLRPGYEQFYIQAFDLSVANLRLRSSSSTMTEPPDPLSEAFTSVFKESYPLARDELKKQNSHIKLLRLDAARVNLDQAYLSRADLVKVWMPGSYLRMADLTEVCLNEANLTETHLDKGNLSGAQLIEATLTKTNFSWTNLTGANLTGANLTGANLTGANLTGANLTGANLEGTKPEIANSLEKTQLQNVSGLTKSQLDACIAKGAIAFNPNSSKP